MSSLLDGVNQRTQLVGRNRLELLLFYLNGKQPYGINVFKVQEVIKRPALTHMPNSHPTICGVATLRGKTIPILDLGKALGQKPLIDEEGGIIIITEYNRSIQGFLVRGVDRIVNINWEDVVPPPEGAGRDHYLTAIAHVDEEMIEMIDVERVLGTIRAVDNDELVQHVEPAHMQKGHKHLVLVVDDSAVARNQVKNTLEKMGLENLTFKNGKEVYDQLLEWANNEDPILARIAMVISDIEMPEMDGYTLTSKIKNHEKLNKNYVILHTSLSGLKNANWNQEVNADAFVPKFDPPDLCREINKRIEFLDARIPQSI